MVLVSTADASLHHQLGTVETRDDSFCGSGQAEQTDDVVLDFGRSGGGQRDGERVAQLTSRFDDVEIVRAEVVAPLRDAVSLVNGKQAQGQVLKRAEEGHIAEAFGCDVDESIFPQCKKSQTLVLFRERNGAVDEGREDALTVESIHLVFHQRDERGNDEREAVELQRGELVDERFPRARGHGEGVLFVEEGLDGFFLSRAKGVETEVGAEGGCEVRRCHNLSMFISSCKAGSFL